MPNGSACIVLLETVIEMSLLQIEQHPINTLLPLEAIIPEHFVAADLNLPPTQ